MVCEHATNTKHDDQKNVWHDFVYVVYKKSLMHTPLLESTNSKLWREVPKSEGMLNASAPGMVPKILVFQASFRFGMWHPDV